ncbi:MAG: hypothetical protein HYZ14_12480 [Bacteroidetes bacterium]|nr:hypothetical protein [Bacteroidota bacterium]
MNSLTDVIELIRKRPAMYIGKESIHALKAFIDGWYFRDTEGAMDTAFLGEFQKWTENRYAIKSGQSWADIILFYSYDEKDALTNFFKNYDQWKSDKSKSS